MPLYLCGESALEMWRHLRTADVYNREPHKVCRKSAITNAVHTNHQLNSLSSHAERLLDNIPRPFDILVSGQNERCPTDKLRPHVWSRRLPRGTFVDLGGGVYLSSGPFLFLQLATEFDFIQLIRTGMELCGIYSLFPLHAVELEPTDPIENMRHSYTGLVPVTSAARIGRFLEGCMNQPGRRTAEQALRHVLDDSGSPMETASYMLACLPRRNGGHGIEQPVLNPKLTVQTKSGPRVRRPDLYWPGRSVDVEYNSDLIHLAKDRYYQDARRQVELTVARVNVLPLTRADVMSAYNFDRFVFLLAKALGVRLRAYPENWEERRSELRESLFANW